MGLWNVAKVEGVPYADEPEGTTHVFVQPKNTHICFDFWCECGAQAHFDGYFAQRIQCPLCGTLWDMPATVYPRRVEDGDGSYEHIPVVPGLDQEDPSASLN